MTRELRHARRALEQARTAQHRELNEVHVTHSTERFGWKRYHLSNGWFIDRHDNKTYRRHSPTRKYDAYEPGAAETGGAAFRCNATRLDACLAEVNRIVRYTPVPTVKPAAAEQLPISAFLH